MKKLFFYIVNFIKEDFHLWTYLYTGILLSLAIYFNYKYNIFQTLMGRKRGMLIDFSYSILFFGVAYYGVLVPKLIAAREGYILRKLGFLLSSALLVVAVSTGIFIKSSDLMTFFLKIIKIPNENNASYFIFYNLSHLKLFVIWTGIPLLLYLLTPQYFRKPKRYGLTFKNLSWSLYGLMFLLMVPILIFASFQDSFLRMYPLLKFEHIEGLWSLSFWRLVLIFEIIYAFAFIGTEIIFRGAFVLGFVNVLGRHAVLPMASIYCFIHFNKPVLETISSIFGGYILGILALFTYNIMGGIVLHIGIAWGMDLLSFIHKNEYFS